MASQNRDSQQHNQEEAMENRWKTDKQQQNYSSNLLQALRRVSLNPSSAAASSAPRRGRAVREAADRVLAVAAKGRTRWSRAILTTNRLKIKFGKHKKQRAPAAARSSPPTKKPRVSLARFKAKNLPAVERKARVLGRLVPGCGKESLPVILEEATDYIAALEMQVRTMTALAELLSASAGTATAPASATTNQSDSGGSPAS